MIKIAVVDDENESSSHLTSLLEKYFQDSDFRFGLETFSSAESFLARMKDGFDIVFFDVDLPGDNGFEAAMKLRETNEEIVIFFCTKLAQFAIKGYKAKAMNYFVKPVSYYDLKMELDYIVPKLAEKENKYHLNVTIPKGVRHIPMRDIVYIESQGHTIIYHLKDETLSVRGNPLSSMEKKLSEYGFVCCNASFLVNLYHCKALVSDELTMDDGSIIKVTRSKRKRFNQAFSEYLSTHGVKEDRS